MNSLLSGPPPAFPAVRAAIRADAMKACFCMLACTLAIGGAQAAPADAACAARPATNAAAHLASTLGPLDEAIATLDNARVTLPSPSLASDTMSYLTIAPNFGDRIEHLCVLGYFELESDSPAPIVPLVVESIDVVKAVNPHDAGPAQPSTRIYFQVPRLDAFQTGQAQPPVWKFWQREQKLHFKIAAFDYADGVRGRAYFGRKLSIVVSSKGASIVAACLFAVVFYLLAGAAIVPVGRVPGAAQRGWRGAVRRLLPWNITGTNGQASLSQLQMLLFTLIVATLLFYQWLRTGLLQELSTDLLYLIGISTAGTAASQAALAIRKNLDPAIYQYVQELGWFNAPVLEAGARGRPSGLLLTNQRFDVYKFQMLVFTCVIAAYVIASGANELGNIQISATLLTLMGMSQGAYVGGRAAVDVHTPLQDQLRGMQVLQQRYQGTTDPLVAEALRHQFRLAATQAGAMFGTMFGRQVPSSMLSLPVDAVGAVPAPAPAG
jgi:hypothetical protein